MWSTSPRQLVWAIASVGHVAAFWRMPCTNRLISERIDPIVNPGVLSGHVHNIAGGSGISTTSGYADMRASTCTSCPITEDLSAYWTPQLYYQYENGSFISVPNGGMTVYYLQRTGNSNEALRAFPEGFRMLSGSSGLRTYDASSRAQQAVNFVCLDYSSGNDKSSYTNALPNKNCPDGLRLQVIFPSCWDGVNLDSADHKSHVAFPTGISTGSCDNPKFPVRLITLFYEVFYDVDNFKDMWYGSGQPFVLANGDPTGYGFHADFLNGWNTTVLQKAVDTCTNLSGKLEDCDAFTLSYPKSSAAQCHKSPAVDEVVMDVILPTLPGCNPVTNATSPTLPCPAKTTPALWKNTTGFYGDIVPFGYGSTSGKSVVQSYKNWKYAGCYQDTNARVLQTRFTAASMTAETCLDLCGSKGFSYGGIEWSQECWCGNTLQATAISYQSCSMTCSGNATQYCGGSMALTMYKLDSAAVSPSLSSSSSVAKTTTTSSSSVAKTTTTSKSTTSTTTTTSASAASTVKTIPQVAGVYNFTGCYLDSSTRVLTQRMTSGDGSTELCASTCRQQGYAVMGVEYGGECYCDTALAAGAQTRPTTDCNMACTKAPGSLCGAGWAMQVYITSLPAPTYDDFTWSYAGCYTDSYTRTLRTKVTAARNDAPSCRSACQAKGYVVAGLENWGTECWCDAAIASTGTLRPDGECNQPCDADKTTLCGGSWRLGVYTATRGGAKTTTTSSSVVSSSTAATAANGSPAAVRAALATAKPSSSSSSSSSSTSTTSTSKTSTSTMSTSKTTTSTTSTMSKTSTSATSKSFTSTTSKTSTSTTSTSKTSTSTTSQSSTIAASSRASSKATTTTTSKSI